MDDELLCPLRYFKVPEVPTPAVKQTT